MQNFDSYYINQQSGQNPYLNHYCPVHGNRSYQPASMYRQIMMEDAIGIARQQVPGQVVEAELKNKYGRFIYEVDVVTSEGVKYEVKIDANSGEILEVELD